MASLPPDALTVRSGRVRQARRLATRRFRAETGLFLAEGPQAVRESLADSVPAREVFATDAATDRHRDVRDAARAAGVTWTLVDEEVLAHLADATTPQGLVAVCRSVVRDLDALPTRVRLVVVCHDMRDPGNAGAVIRCADAAGADAVVLSAHSVDPLNPKAVRASVGSLFHLPVIVEQDHGAVLAALRERGLRVLATDGEAERDLFDPGLDLAAPTAWVMGNEAQGLPAAVRDAADEAVAVPILGRAESLNLATAAAVCLYASARHQRPSGGDR